MLRFIKYLPDVFPSSICEYVFKSSSRLISLTDFSKQTFLLSDFAELTSEVVFKFVAEDVFYDGNDGSGGSLVEAAIDNFKLEYVSDNIVGDLNGDLEVNVLDVVVMINILVGGLP